MILSARNKRVDLIYKAIIFADITGIQKNVVYIPSLKKGY